MSIRLSGELVEEELGSYPKIWVSVVNVTSLEVSELKTLAESLNLPRYCLNGELEKAEFSIPGQQVTPCRKPPAPHILQECLSLALKSIQSFL